MTTTRNGFQTLSGPNSYSRATGNYGSPRLLQASQRVTPTQNPNAGLYGLLASGQTSGTGGAQGFSLLNPGAGLASYSNDQAPSILSSVGTGATPVPSSSSSTVGVQSPYADFDPNSDPVYAQIKALGDSQYQQAEAQALGQKKGDLISFGYSPELASLYPDQATADAAKGNTTSTLAQLLSNHEGRTHSIDQNSNLANLFYSSTRANTLGDEGKQYLGEQASAGGKLGELLAGLDSNLLGTKMGIQGQLMQALMDAYNRALANKPVASAAGGGSTPDNSASTPIYGPSQGIANVISGGPQQGQPFLPTPIAGKRVAF